MSLALKHVHVSRYQLALDTKWAMHCSVKHHKSQQSPICAFPVGSQPYCGCAMRRLLDDNRELYVPELQEAVRPHPHFQLFATQNPAGAYAGRRPLSRAFRSRFLELHVGDIPDGELAIILELRCEIAPSHAAKLVDVLRTLERHRQVGLGSSADGMADHGYAGKHEKED